MSISPVSKLYPQEERVQEEARQYGLQGYAPSVKLLGFTDPWNAEQSMLYLDGKRGNGSPCLREMKNRNTDLYGWVIGTSASINKLATLSGEHLRERVLKALYESADVGIQYLERQGGMVRHGAGGKLITPASLSYLKAGHMTNANGEAFLHTHVWIHRYGILPDGQTRSLAYCPKLLVHAKKGEELTQLAFAARLEEELGLKVAIERGMAVVPALEKHQETEHLVGGRRREALKYLEERGVKATPGAVAAAVYKTRPKEVKLYRKKDLTKTWGEKATGIEAPSVMLGQSEKDRGTWGWAAKSVIASAVTAPLGVFATAFMKPYTRKDRKVIVKDVDQFLHDVGKRSLVECHKAAIRALHRANVGSFGEALTVAEAAFKKARRPKLKLPPGTRVVVSSEATTEQREKLCDLAGKHGWRLKNFGERHGY